MNTVSDTLIDLLRHGEVEGQGGCLMGRTDTPLSRQGLERMGEVTQGGAWDVICSSPLRRCAVFAETLARFSHIPLIMEPRLVELNFGEWEGQRLGDILAIEPEALEHFWGAPTAPVARGGESIASLAQRVTAAMGDLVRDHQGKHVLLVTHGGVVRAVLAWTLALPLTSLLRIEVPPASLSRVRIPEQGWPSLVFHNRLSIC